MARTPAPVEFDTTDKDAVKAYLSRRLAFPDMQDSCSREYEMAIVSMIEKHGWTYDTASETLGKICGEIREPSADFRLCYAAFYALCTYYRKNNHFTRYQELLREYDTVFRVESSFGFLELMYHSQNPKEVNKQLLLDAEQLCKQDCFQKNYGVFHLYAEIVAIYIESFDKNTPPQEDLHFLDDAKGYVEKAITASKVHCSGHGYPKFYMTRARLYYLKAIYGSGDQRRVDFDNAHADVLQAINYETDRQKMESYQMKEMSLQSSYYKVSLGQELDRLKTKVQEIDRESTKKNLESLSFFSAVLSLIITGATLATGVTFPHSAALLLILTGCIILAFGAFGLMISNRKKANMLMITVGTVLLIGAMIYGYKVC